jgi:hypothetical protein
MREIAVQLRFSWSCEMMVVRHGINVICWYRSQRSKRSISSWEAESDTHREADSEHA